MIYGDQDKIKQLFRRYRWGLTRDSERRPEWQKLSAYISPAHGRFLTERDTIPAKGKVDRSKILNSTATRAKAIAVAGIKGGLVPHSLKWFKLGLYDAELESWQPAKDWLYEVEKVLYSVFNRSNFYEAIYMPFDEQLTFGTGPFQIDEHDERVIHCDPWTCGEYVLMNGSDKVVDTGFRTYYMTLRAMVQKFGKENLSDSSRNMFTNNPDQFIKVINVILPREDYDPSKVDNLNMPWASVWFEDKCSSKGSAESKVLGESGYRTRPVMYPRWLTIGEDPYGSDSPGLQNLGDIMQLQAMERDKLAAIALTVRPPMNVPSKMFGRLNINPNGQNKVDDKDKDKVGRTIDIDYRIGELSSEIMNVERRIKEGFFNDLFLMILNTEKSGTTAYEIARKNEEKLVLLGPVVERQNSELLTPAIDRVFDVCMARGLFPSPPSELQGADIRVEYVSLLAQAQKAVGISGIEKTVNFVGSLMEAFPETRYKIDASKTIDDYADHVGMSPMLIRSNEEAEKLLQADQRAAQQAQDAEQAAQAAVTAKDLSQAELPDGDNTLNRLMGSLPAA